MDDTPSTLLDNTLAPTKKQGDRWQARLSLEFTQRLGRTYLAKREHAGPLVIQKTLHPEGESVCHGIIVHPPGGVAGGDELTLNVSLDQASHALITTPGAGKWYKANGLSASQHLEFNVLDAACFEWLPQENILFDGSQVKFSANVNLDADAKYAAWEILCFGRQAQGELWQTGSLQQQFAIRRTGELIWQERTCLSTEQGLLKSIVGLHGKAVSASFVIAAGAVPAEVLAACREIKPIFALDLDAKYAVTALPEVFSARYVGQSAQSARQYFEQLLHILRPWYSGRELVRPRIWNT